ncbi:unnamed protein product [Schistocephalus solidus]|uniref:Uncharacterized protein n=1 Tax=Schistocephalus solidus TaxID=70667 RepID=A0A183SNQ7_SCHSO|nr:unnamed protein product [Schistocephalus solidus]
MTCRILRGDEEDVVSVDRVKAAVTEEPPNLRQGQDCSDPYPCSFTLPRLYSILPTLSICPTFPTTPDPNSYSATGIRTTRSNREFTFPTTLSLKSFNISFTFDVVFTLVVGLGGGTVLLAKCPRPRTSSNQDWVDDDDVAIHTLLAEKNRLHKAYVYRPTAANKITFYRLVQGRLREMQDAWMALKAEEIQRYAVYNSPPKELLLFSELTELPYSLSRCILNRSSTISDDAIDRLHPVESTANLNVLLSLQKHIRAMQQLFGGKAPGSDAIPAETYTHGDPQLIHRFRALFPDMWRQGHIPRDYKDATTVPF